MVLMTRGATLPGSSSNKKSGWSLGSCNREHLLLPPLNWVPCGYRAAAVLEEVIPRIEIPVGPFLSLLRHEDVLSDREGREDSPVIRDKTDTELSNAGMEVSRQCPVALEPDFSGNEMGRPIIALRMSSYLPISPEGRPDSRAL